MAKPELGTKRLCPNCGAKYYDLNRDPILCPKCNAVFATGVVATSRRAAKEEDEDEAETEDEGVELVTLEEAAEEDADAVPDDEDIGVTDDDVTVDADDDVLVDDDDDNDDEVSDVVRGADNEEEER